jgi:hypothetical protein
VKSSHKPPILTFNAFFVTYWCSFGTMPWCNTTKNLDLIGSKRNTRSHKRYFTIVLHVFFPQNNFFIWMIFWMIFLQLVMKNDWNCPNKSKKNLNHFVIIWICKNVQIPCRFYVSSWKMRIIWNHTKKS